MPLYDFLNKDTGEVEEHRLSSYKDLDGFLEENPHLEKQISSPSIVTHTGNIVSQTSSDWRNHLDRIKKNSGKNNTIKTY